MDREIRFIDSSYRELFKIPDGGIVKITLSDGEIMERWCKYIDDYHFELLRPGKDYGETFHICQFAEINERNGNTYEPIFGKTYTLEVPATDEQELVYRSSDKSDRGCIGWLRCDFGREGDRFYSTWTDDNKVYKTDEFCSEIDDVVNYFRMRPDTPILRSRADMSRLCNTVPGLKLENGWTDMYMFKVQSEKHTYFIRCSPKKGDYNAYVYAYNTERLQQYKDTRYVEQTYGELPQDKFYKQNGGVLEMYYNPDAVAGGQIVQVYISDDVIKEAAKKYKKPDMFFSYLSEHGKCFLIDAGTNMFRENVDAFVKLKNDFEGCSQKTMDGLKKHAGIRVKKDMER